MQEALKEEPNLAVVKLYCFEVMFQAEVKFGYCTPRIMPVISCMKTHRSPLWQLAAAIEVFDRNADGGINRLVEGTEVDSGILKSWRY